MNTVHSSEVKLSDQDLAIVKAIESSGRYKLWGWEVPDYCTLNLVFDDAHGSCRMGMTIDFYPVDKTD